MRQLTEEEHERLLSIERAYRKLRDERRPYVNLRRAFKQSLMLTLTEEQAERAIGIIEARTTPPTDAYLLRKPENDDKDTGPLH